MKEQDELINAIKIFLEITGDIRVISKGQGSVRLRIELTREQAERLLGAIKAGEFLDHGVQEAEMIYSVEAGDSVGVEEGKGKPYGVLPGKRRGWFHSLRKLFRPKHCVAVLGPRSVGKTCLLHTLGQEFSSTMDFPNRVTIALNPKI